MNEVQIRDIVLDALSAIAPDADTSGLAPDKSFRDQLDYFDSMDFFNFVVGLHKAFGIDIPEADYPRLSTLDACTRYFKTKLG